MSYGAEPKTQREQKRRCGDCKRKAVFAIPQRCRSQACGNNADHLEACNYQILPRVISSEEVEGVGRNAINVENKQADDGYRVCDYF